MAASRHTSCARRDSEGTDAWYRGVERAKDKARKYQNQMVALDQKTSVVVGIVSAVDIDHLWQFKWPYCKVSMVKAVRFGPNGNVEARIGDAGVFWLNKPDNVLPLEELAKRYPKVHEEVLVKMKGGGW